MLNLTLPKFVTLPDPVFPNLKSQIQNLKFFKMVGPGGLEPPTPRLSSVCSNQLSYGPLFEASLAGIPVAASQKRRLVEPRRLELLTLCVQSRCSSN